VGGPTWCQANGRCVPAVRAIDSGGMHTCAVLQENGQVSCWGSNVNGELGAVTADDKSRNPLTVPGISGATAVSAGGTFTCALLGDSTLRCWGANGVGQLGNGTMTDSLSPVDPGLVKVTSVTAGYDFACARTSDGNIWCWGNNESGQLGNGNTLKSSTPVQVLNLGTAINAIAAGYDFACAIIDDGTVRCWGDNYFGQLGNGTFQPSTTPAVVSSLSGLSSDRNALAATCGVPMEGMKVEGTTCAVMSDGTARCWGSYLMGALGNGATDDSNVPVTVSSLQRATALTAGYAFVCAVASAGSVWCWGSGSWGQLGNGRTDSGVLTPVSVLNLTTVTTVSAGVHHVCALLADSTVKCWGSNSWGQLGTGSATEVYVEPVSVNW
jgi:alpha-tubulin suppressor-like RCC1 family protein